MTLSLSTAVALLALAVAVFAVLALAAVYARLRQLERIVLDPGTAEEPIPARLLPGPGDRATVVLVLDGECPLCVELSEAADEAALEGLRLVRVYASAAAAGPAENAETDPDVWRAVYEGYTPTVSVVDAGGKIAERRFVYADTDPTVVFTDIAGRFGSAAVSGGTR